MKKGQFLLLCVFFLAFYIQNRYAIVSVDDWVYAFVVNDGAEGHLSIMDDGATRQPVASLRDAIVSQSRDYFTTNGRFVVHTIVQFCCGTMDMPTFAVLNSMVFALFTLLVVLLTGVWRNTLNLLLTLSAIWILLPHKGLTFLGNISLSVNYLWVSVATLAFVFIIECLLLRQRISWPTAALTVLFALVCGSLQESFSIGMSGALLLFLLLNRKAVSGKIALVFTAYVAGTMICALSPANFGRSDDIGGLGFHWRSLLGVLSSPPIVLTAVALTLLAAKGRLKSFAKGNFLLLSAAAINLFFAIFVAYNGRHQLTAVNVFCLVLLVRLWVEGEPSRLRQSVSIALISLALVSYYPILQIRKAYHDAFSTLTARAFAENHGGVVSGAEFERLTEQINQNRIVEGNFVATFTFQDWDFYEHSLSAYLTKGENNRLIEEITEE